MRDDDTTEEKMFVFFKLICTLTYALSGDLWRETLREQEQSLTVNVDDCCGIFMTILNGGAISRDRKIITHLYS